MNKVRFSAIEIIQFFVNIFSGLIGFISLLYLFAPKFQEKIGDKLFPFLDKITVIQWWVVLGTVTIFLIIFNYSIIWYKKKNDISTLPFIKLAGADITNVLPNVNSYGANSFIAKDLHRTRKLFYLDLINDPIKKENNDAVGVSVEITYFRDGEFTPYRKHLARWIDMPEKELGISHIYKDIPSDGKTKVRWGMGYVDNEYGDNFFLLDAEQTDLSSHGIMINPPFLPEGKYTVVANISGKNLWDIEPFVFEISTIGNEPVKLFIKKDDKQWLKVVEKEKEKMSKLWSSLT